jgi:hypothetical protein
VVAEAGREGVLEHVLDRLGEVLLGLDQAGAEAVAEDVPAAAVFGVVALGVAAVQELHSIGELPAGAFDDGVVVGAEQRECVDRPVEAVDGASEEGEEEAAVVVVPKEHPAGDGARVGVVDPVGEQRAGLACHQPSTVAGKKLRNRACGKVVPLP